MEMSGAIYRKEISSGQKKLEKWGSLTWLAGKQHTIGDDKVIVEAGDSLLIREGVFHNATSAGECDADMIVAYSSSTREMIEE